MLLAVGLAVVCISSGAQAPQQSTANPAVPAQAPPSSQEVAPSQTPAIRASSDLVRIDVEVTDKSGKAVKGLTPEQFSISENGKAQKISIFTFQDIEKMETAQSDDTKPIVVAIDSPNTPAAAEAISNQVRDRRMLVLFFDLTSMQTDDIARAHDAALKFVQKQMTSADLVSIVTYAARLTVWADFTNDRAKLEKAVALLTPDVASQLADLSYAAAQNGEYDVQQYTGAAYTADETEFNVFNTDQKLLAVEGLANVLAAIPGRKAVIEFTGGSRKPAKKIARNCAPPQTPPIAPMFPSIPSMRAVSLQKFRAATPPRTLLQARRCSRAPPYFTRQMPARIRATRWRHFPLTPAVAHFSTSAI